MKSPITGKQMKLVKEVTTLPYRKDEFTVVYHSFVCEETGETFTNDELDHINLVQVHNAYREKYGIPTVDEIKSIRKKYALTASKMSEILGFGPNTYRLYENGEVPSVANGRLILAVDEPHEFLKQINASSYLLSRSELSSLREKVELIEQQEKANIWERLFERKIFNDQSANEFTGYRKPSVEKVSQIISFFSQFLDLYKTKVNKLLFYADFLHYKMYGVSITGLSYRAIQYGPVPAEYDKLYMKLQDDGRIETIHVQFNDECYGERYRSKEFASSSQLEDTELRVLERVLEVLGKMTSTEIKDYSHEEVGWIHNQAQKNLISYQKYAFELNL